MQRVGWFIGEGDILISPFPPQIILFVETACEATPPHISTFSLLIDFSGFDMANNDMQACHNWFQLNERTHIQYAFLVQPVWQTMTIRTIIISNLDSLTNDITACQINIFLRKSA